MKTTISREMTTLAQLSNVRTKLNAFKHCYTDGDLIRVFENNLRENAVLYHDKPAAAYVRACGLTGTVLACDVKGFPRDSISDDVSYSVNMTIDSWSEIYKIGFYVDQDLNVSPDPLLVSVERWTRAQ